MAQDPLTHAEVEPMLGAMALLALDREERDLVAGHVQTCPVCQAELAELTAVAGRLAAIDDAHLLLPSRVTQQCAPWCSSRWPADGARGCWSSPWVWSSSPPG